MTHQPSALRIVLIDNYDSFTYNLYDYLIQLDTDCQVFRNDEITVTQLQAIEFDALVLSPGPKSPKDAGILMDIIEFFHATKPILGICLGHQGLGEFFGATLKKAKLPVHGKTSTLFHTNHKLFAGLPMQFEVMRYHSLILEDMELTNLQAIAHTQDGEIMALAHKSYPIVGVQFHPESILTEHGLEMLDNWVRATAVHLTDD